MTQEPSPRSQNPYVGPHTFQRGDGYRFSGRDLEARELLALVISNRVVLFYAESGAGKSSLINKRLIPDLEEDGFEVLLVGRVGGAEPFDVDNPFVHNLMLSLLNESGTESPQLAGICLSDFLRGLDKSGEEYYYPDTSAESAGDNRDAEETPLEIRPRVLIIDQFEEILTTNLRAWQKRSDFFQQLRKAMDKDLYLWVVLSLREDYAAGLDPYAHFLPGGMRTRYYMQRMRKQAAFSAITKPVEDGDRPFTENAGKKLVENLSQVRIPGEERPYQGEFVDPVQLQVVCYQLWENLRYEDPAEITVDDLKEAGDIETALRRYYEDAIDDVVSGLRTTEEDLRNWFDETLITPDGTRDIVPRAETHTAGLPNQDVEILVKRFVLRPVVRSGTTWYELAHDRLVEPILDANREYKEKAGQERMEREWEWATSESGNPNQATHRLTEEDGRTAGLLLPVDVYVQTWEELLNEEMRLQRIYVPREPGLMDGPTSARIAVVDYDADLDLLEDPVGWDRENSRFVFGHNGERVPITREHRDTPQFHQVNVWATIQSVLQMYEATWVLGRSAPWAFEGNRLIVRPHAGKWRNAVYDREAQSIEFGYFEWKGEQIYTCLSHDVIAHETGHAILDGLRPYFYEDSSIQTTAFHEFVADLTAIIDSLLNNELRWEVARESGADLSKDTIVSALAEEYGRYALGRDYLRSAQNPKTMAEVAGGTYYDWSEVLTGAMFDILKGMTADLMATPIRTGRMPTEKQALLWAVNRFRRIAFQSLDYLPPVDVQFSDYARAVLRADEVADPVDQHDFRGLMRQAYEDRGIDYQPREALPFQLDFYAYDIDRLSRSRTDAYHFLNENRRQLCIPADQDISVVDLYHTDKTAREGGKLPREIVLQYAWREPLELGGADYGPLDGEAVSLLCGGTLVFDDRGNVLFWIRKPGSTEQTLSAGRRRAYCGEERDRGEERRGQLLDYLAERAGAGAVGLAEGDRPEEDTPVVARRRRDGTLRLEITPHLRHS